MIQPNRKMLSKYDREIAIKPILANPLRRFRMLNPLTYDETCSLRI